MAAGDTDTEELVFDVIVVDGVEVHKYVRVGSPVALEFRVTELQSQISSGSKEFVIVTVGSSSTVNERVEDVEEKLTVFPATVAPEISFQPEA